jgi:hypothetical protein
MGLISESRRAYWRHINLHKPMKTCMIIFIASLCVSSAIAQDPLQPTKPLPPEENILPAQLPPHPDEIVPPEKKAPPTPERIKALIAQYLDKDRKRSEDAKIELWNIGKLALPQLKEAEKTSNRVHQQKLATLIGKIEGTEDKHGLGPRIGAMLDQLGQIQRPPVIQQNTGQGQRNFNHQVIPLGPNANRPQQPAGPDHSTNLMNSFGCRLIEAADGMRVIEIKAGSPAANAGLAAGDLITAANGREIKTPADAKEHLSAGQGKDIKLEVTRKGESLTMTVAPF